MKVISTSHRRKQSTNLVKKSIVPENVRGMNSIEVSGVADVNTGLSVGGRGEMFCGVVNIC